MALTPVRVGVVGCGEISETYLRAIRRFEILEVVACSDLVPERARDAAKKHAIPRACTTDGLLADPGIEIVLNLTVPRAHYTVAKAALEAGKSVYNEKPLAITREEGRELVEMARKKGLRVGSAPDTFMGAGGQTCRELIDNGAIGEPVAATAFMLCFSDETWKDFYYRVGGGPLFDMGPYYLTTLVSLLGPVVRVTGSARITYPERLMRAESQGARLAKVDVPTHVAGILDLASGAIATIVVSFDVWGAHVPCIEIYGREGSLAVPDPNGFGGPVRMLKPMGRWEKVPLTHGYAGNYRSIGLADMAHGIRTARPHRANGDLAYHVLDIMHGIHDASREGRHAMLQSTCQRPAPLPVGLLVGTLEG